MKQSVIKNIFILLPNISPPLMNQEIFFFSCVYIVFIFSYKKLLNFKISSNKVKIAKISNLKLKKNIDNCKYLKIVNKL